MIDGVDEWMDKKHPLIHSRTHPLIEKMAKRNNIEWGKTLKRLSWVGVLFLAAALVMIVIEWLVYASRHRV